MELSQERGGEDDEQTWLHIPGLPPTRSTAHLCGNPFSHLGSGCCISVTGSASQSEARQFCTHVHMHLHIHVYEIALLARAKKVSTTQVSVEGQGTGGLQHLPTGTLLNIPRKAVLTDACCDMGEWWLVLQEESQSLKDKQCDSADIKHLK